MTDADAAAEAAAITALREATRALSIGEEAETPLGHVPDRGTPELAAEIASVLDAVVRLMNTVDLDPAPTGSSLHAVAQHITAAATLARGVGHDTARGAASDTTDPGTVRLAHATDAPAAGRSALDPSTTTGSRPRARGEP